MREILRILQKAYDHPVDVEFTLNFFDDGQYRVNIVQCRPFPVAGAGSVREMPQSVPKDDLILEAHGAVIGQSRSLDLARIVYVVPQIYGRLSVSDRYNVARLVGRAVHLPLPEGSDKILLLGPGRWGTTTPTLGVPVTFAEIDKVSILCEIVAMRDDLVPDVSLGTHFFNDLVEMDILYMALFPTRKDNHLNEAFLGSAPDRLPELLPVKADWARAVRVIDLRDVPVPGGATLSADSLSQRALCWVVRRAECG